MGKLILLLGFGLTTHKLTKILAKQKVPAWITGVQALFIIILIILSYVW